MKTRRSFSIIVGWSVLAWLPSCVKSETADSSSSKSTASASAKASLSPPSPNVARVEVTPNLERSCREICDRSRRLNCDNATKCMPNCLAMGSLTPCSEPITSFYGCLVGQPVHNWKCASDGVAAIEPGFCDREQEATVACMEAKMR